MDDDDMELSFDPTVGAGVWANSTRVADGLEEITIDFICRDPFDPEHGTVVARVSLPLGAALEFQDRLIESLSGYSRWEWRDESQEPDDD